MGMFYICTASVATACAYRACEKWLVRLSTVLLICLILNIDSHRWLVAAPLHNTGLESSGGPPDSSQEQ